MDIVERLRNNVGGESYTWKTITEAANEIERLRAALQEYCDGQYVGYVSLPCGWDDWGTLAKYALEGLSLDDYKADCKMQNDIDMGKNNGPHG